MLSIGDMLYIAANERRNEFDLIVQGTHGGTRMVFYRGDSPSTVANKLREMAAEIEEIEREAPRYSPVILGVDAGLTGGDLTGYACSCGKVRVETEGQCERDGCPVPASRAARKAGKT